MLTRSQPASRDDVIALAAAVSALLGLLALHEDHPADWLAQVHHVLLKAVADRGDRVTCALDCIFADAVLAVQRDGVQ